MNRVPLALAAPLLIFGCGQDGAADDNAAALERAAGQSGPEAEDILRNAADPGGNVQDSLRAAGNAQAATQPPPKILAEGNSQ